MANRNLILASAGLAGEEPDPNFNQTVLLLHGDGTNGAQNNTFVDSSSNNFTITRNGNTTQGTFSPYGDLWSNYFDGTGDKLTVAANAAFQFGTGDFTIEFWLYPTSLVGYLTPIDMGYTVSGAYLIQTQLDNGVLDFYAGGFLKLTSSSALAVNAFNHVVVCRSGTTLSMFLNGIRTATTTDSTNLNANNTLGIGAAAERAQDFPVVGYMSNVRLVKGSHPYDATQTTITVPTAPLTAVANTSLLTCQSNRFKDNSSNNFTLTPNGNVRVTNFSPFAPSAAYDPAVNGGSGYFDGNGDYLTVADNAAFEIDGDFTIEAWFYINTLPSAGNYANIINKGASGIYQPYYIFVQNGSLLFYSSSNGTSWNVASASSFGTVTAGQWYHVAVSRSGTALRMFFNGALVNTITNGDALYNNNRAVALGARSDGTEDDLVGYISDARIVKGTALYTSTFTPPTAPLTAVSGTSLLCNFTNAGIIDNTGKNVLETVGNAQVDTAVKKYGTGSMEFDGSGDYLQSPFTPDLNLGTGDFTVEFWFNSSSLSGVQRLFCTDTGAWTANTLSIGYGYPTASKLYMTVGDDVFGVGGSTTLSTGTWYHLAVTRSGTSVRMFLNGTLEASGTSSDNLNFGRAFVGGFYSVSTTEFFNGYIDDLRITKGVARYTANFTPPAKEFPNL